MPAIPRIRELDSTLALALEGYDFIRRRCRRLHSDVFETRVMLRKTVCMLGAEAAELFYDESRFQRGGAAPERLRQALLGRWGVQGLDGQDHRHRKQLFMSLLSQERLAVLVHLTSVYWRAYARKWEGQEQVVLLHEAQELLCRAVCEWAGVPLPEREVERRTRDLAAMIDGAGTAGPRYWRGRRARSRVAKWLGRLVKQTRAGKVKPGPGSALHAMSWHRELDGRLLPRKVAVEELLNVLRPSVDLARYVSFCAVALHQHPIWLERLRESDADLMSFVQEVRRFFPFSPALSGRVRASFEWNGYRFSRGRRVMLDLYGTNHDPRLWDQPGQFRPERFRHWVGDPYTLIPQGGGEHHRGHRCAGEWLTIEVMKESVRFLARSLRYQVPEQDLRIRHSRVPAIPRSRFVMTGVQFVPETYRAQPPPPPRRQAISLESPGQPG